MPAHLSCDQASHVLREVAVKEVRLPKDLDAVVQLRGALRRRAQNYRYLRRSNVQDVFRSREPGVLRGW